MKEDFLVIRHQDLDKKMLDEIIRLKQQHWQYSYDSQKEWIEKFMEPEAVHLLLKVEDQYVAYLSVRNIGMEFDGKKMMGKGLGNVCVDKNFQKYGFGKRIVQKANQMILDGDDVGVLLCHTHLIPFYERCGWTVIQYEHMYVNESEFFDILMLLNSETANITCGFIDRSF